MHKRDKGRTVQQENGELEGKQHATSMIASSQFFWVAKDLTTLVHSSACIGFFILVSGLDVLGGRLSWSNRLRPIFKQLSMPPGLVGRTYLDFCL